MLKHFGVLGDDVNLLPTACALGFRKIFSEGYQSIALPLPEKHFY